MRRLALLAPLVGLLLVRAPTPALACDDATFCEAGTICVGYTAFVRWKIRLKGG